MKKETKKGFNGINCMDVGGNAINKKKDTFLLIILPIICCGLLILLFISYFLAILLDLFTIVLFRNIILALIGISAIIMVINILIRKRTYKQSK